jgi:hypothetical protein
MGQEHQMIDPGRTHEPTLREVVAELDGLRRLLLAKIEAQREALEAADKRYEQRFAAQESAVGSALVGQEKAVNAALVAADRAVLKAEGSAEKRFDAVNEFRAQLADQATTFLPRAEALVKFEALSEKIEALRVATGLGAGRYEGGQIVKDESRANLALAVSVIGLLVVLGGVVTSIAVTLYK